MPRTLVKRILGFTIAALLLGASVATAETSVPYTDMIQAYEAGNLTLARQLAKKHLARARMLLDTAAIDPDKDGAIRFATGLTDSILRQESDLQPADQFRNAADLAITTGEVLSRSKEVHDQIRQSSPAERNFREGQLSDQSTAWVQAAGPRVSSTQVNEFFGKFRDVQLKRGVTSPQQILNAPKVLKRNSIQQNNQIQAVPSTESSAIRAAVDAYFLAVTRGTAAQIAAATGATTALAQSALSARTANYQREKVKSVTSYRLPVIADWAALVRSVGTELVLNVPDIQMTVVTLEGVTVNKTVSKNLRLAQKPGGGWLVKLPNGVGK